MCTASWTTHYICCGVCFDDEKQEYHLKNQAIIVYQNSDFFSEQRSRISHNNLALCLLDSMQLTVPSLKDNTKDKFCCHCQYLRADYYFCCMISHNLAEQKVLIEKNFLCNGSN